MLLDRHHEAPKVEAFGECRSVGDWAAAIGVDPRVLKKRLRFVPAETALSMPLMTRIKRLHIPGGAPKSWTWEMLAYEDDPWARQFVEAHPDGATLELVGEVLGITRERVRQIEEVALRKLRRGSEGRRLRSVIVGMRDGVEVWGHRAHAE